MTWVVACFEPFGGARTNSSLIMHARLRAGEWAGRVEFTPPLPVSFADAWPTLERELAARGRDVAGVLTLGQAAGRATIDLERVALNYVDSELADNLGFVPPRGPLAPGPDVRWSNVPWDAFASEGTCARSYSAGTYVCNAVLYHSLAWAEARGTRAGFVHVPALVSQAEFAHLPRLDDERAYRALADVLDFVVKL